MGGWTLTPTGRSQYELNRLIPGPARGANAHPTGKGDVMAVLPLRDIVVFRT